MSDDLTERIARLEEQLQRRDDEIRAKERSFAEALEREQQKHREREAKDTAKRDELNQRVLQLTDERGKLSSQLEALREQEEEFKKTDAQLRQLKKDVGQMRVQHAEERQNLIEQRDDKRRQADKAQQELADLRCQLSILDHKYQHVMTKQQQQESQAEEMSKAHVGLKALQERLEDTEREQAAEAARFTRDRKALEDRIARLQQDLAREREGPSRVELTAKYQSVIAAKVQLLARALNATARTGGPLVPRDAEDDDVVATYLDRIERFVRDSEAEADLDDLVAARRRGVSPPNNQQHGLNSSAPHVQRSPGAGAGASPLGGTATPVPADALHASLREKFAPDVTDLLEELIAALQLVPEERRASLVRRFKDSVEANVANSRRFAERSGFPSHKEDPLVLVNHIANLTNERDALLLKLRERIEPRAGLESRSGSMRQKSASPNPAYDDPNNMSNAGGIGAGAANRRLAGSASPGGRSRSPATGRRAWK